MGKNLTDRQSEAHVWMMRTWDKDNMIASYEKRKSEIISQLSGIGKYDADFIPSQTGENSVESKNIEYSCLCMKIEGLVHEIAEDNIKTMTVLEHIQSVKIRNMLYDRDVNRMSWNQIGDKYHYAQRQPYNYMHKCLDEVRKYIPEEEIRKVVYEKDEQI